MGTGHRYAVANDSFACQFRQVRIRINAKQFWLAREIGCSAAAISLWENGSRLPRQITMRRVFQALERGGAQPNELVSLLVAWQSGVDKRTPGVRAAPTSLGPVTVF